MIAELEKVGGYLCSAEEREKLRKAMWPDGRTLNRRFRALRCRTSPGWPGSRFRGPQVHHGHGREDRARRPLLREKLSVVMTVWKWRDFDEMLDRMERMLQFSGIGHSANIHTADQEQVEKYAERSGGADQRQHAALLVNSGSWYNGSLYHTIGCGTWAGNMTSDNVTGDTS